MLQAVVSLIVQLRFRAHKVSDCHGEHKRFEVQNLQNIELLPKYVRCKVVIQFDVDATIPVLGQK